MKPIAHFVLGICCSLTLPAHAMTITNSLSVSGEVFASDSILTAAFGPTTSATFVSDGAGGADGSIYGIAWGNDKGRYLSVASASGVTSVSSRFQNTLSLTNNSGHSTDYSLNFYIGSGGLYAGANGNTGNGYGSYDLKLMKNSSELLFSSSTKLESNGVLTTGGTRLNGSVQNVFPDYGYHSYDWSGTNITLDLGLLAGGDSMTIDFSLLTTAFANYGFRNNGFCVDGIDTYGNACDVINYITGTSIAVLGDSFTKDENALPSSSVPVGIISSSHTIPLPGTLVLLGIGLFGLGAMRRTKAI